MSWCQVPAGALADLGIPGPQHSPVLRAPDLPSPHLSLAGSAAHRTFCSGGSVLYLRL